jgi:hypothetical protein
MLGTVGIFLKTTEEPSALRYSSLCAHKTGFTTERSTNPRLMEEVIKCRPSGLRYLLGLI